MQILLTQNSFERQQRQLCAIAPHAQFVLVTAPETFSLNGRPISRDDVQPQIAWLSQDSWQTGLLRTITDAIERSNPEWVQAHLAGLDNPIFRSIIAKGTRITKNAGQAVPIAEYVMAHALSLFVPVDRQRDLQARREWLPTPFREVSGSHWGILGWGEIGREIAKRAVAFDAKVSGFRRSGASDELVGRTHSLSELPDHLPNFDVVVLALPSSLETRKMVNEAFLAAMKPTSILINVARGALVDEDALRIALDSNVIAQAVLDVFETEPLPADSWIWGHPKVRMSPHSSWDGAGNAQRMDEHFLENLRRFLAGEPLLNEATPREVGI